MNKPRAVEIAIVAVVVTILAASLPERSDTTWVDPVTGSVKRQASWQIYQRAPVVEPSAIEKWIIRREGSHTPSWRIVSRSTRSIFGNPLSISCNDAPMYLPRAGDRNTLFVRSSTDSQINKFAWIMRTGSEDERREAITAAYRSASRDD